MMRKGSMCRNLGALARVIALTTAPKRLFLWNCGCWRGRAINSTLCNYFILTHSPLFKIRFSICFCLRIRIRMYFILCTLIILNFGFLFMQILSKAQSSIKFHKIVKLKHNLISNTIFSTKINTICTLKS